MGLIYRPLLGSIIKWYVWLRLSQERYWWTLLGGGKSKRRYITVNRPFVIAQYNKNMGGVDLVDSIMLRYKILARSNKWQVRMFYHLLDLTMSNAWLLYKIVQKSTSGSSSQFVLFSVGDCWDALQAGKKNWKIKKGVKHCRPGNRKKETSETHTTCSSETCSARRNCPLVCLERQKNSLLISWLERVHASDMRKMRRRPMFQ